MKSAPFPSNETERIQALKRYDIIGTDPESNYDDIAFIASTICNTPITLISFIDTNQQWFKAHLGWDKNSTDRAVSLCAHTIITPNNLLIVTDTAKDDRFYDNPIVVNDPKIKFYAGVSLITPDGYNIGSLCVLDRKTRRLNGTQINTLQLLAKQVISELELKRMSTELRKCERMKRNSQLLQELNYLRNL